MKRTIAELALEYKEQLVDGKPVVYGVVNRGQLHDLVQRRAKTGQKVMAPYIKWLVRTQGKREVYAQAIAALTYNTLWETGGEPILKLQDSMIPIGNYVKIRHALKLFAVWITTAKNSTGEDREYGRQLLNDLTNLPRRKHTLWSRPPTLVKNSRQLPLEEELVQKLLRAIDRRHKEVAKRHPWYGPTMRIMVLTGIRPPDLVYIYRTDVVKAWEEHLAGIPAGITIWRNRIRHQMILVGICPKEIGAWATWPYEWNQITDIIDPRYVRVQTRRPRGAFRLLNKAMRREVEALTGTWTGNTFWARLRYAAALRMARILRGDWLTVQQALGMSDVIVSHLRRLPPQ